MPTTALWRNYRQKKNIFKMRSTKMISLQRRCVTVLMVNCESAVRTADDSTVPDNDS